MYCRGGKSITWTTINGKSKFTVHFQAQAKDATPGGIFGLRILKATGQ